MNLVSAPSNTRIMQKPRLLILAVSAASLSLLAGCPTTMDELLNKSRINSVTISPSPVSAPTSPDGSPFEISVASDSNGDWDMLIVSARNPHDGGKFTYLREAAPCPNRTTGGGCGSASISIQCYSINSTFHAGERTVNCGVGAATVDLPPGRHTMLVEIVRRDPFGIRTPPPHDSVEATLNIQ